MGLMDKMKAQASQLADKAQEAGKVGQAKLNALQARRRADGLLTELGRMTYQSAIGKPVADEQARANDLVEQIRQYEAEYGSLDDNPSSSAT